MLKQGNRDGWPSIDFASVGSPVLVADGSTFAAHVAAAASHASRDETRPILTGVRVETVDGSLARLVATDSYRLIVRDIQAETFAPDMAYTIPAAVLKAATDKASGDVAVFVDGANDREWVTVSRDGETWRIRTIGGQYPNWQQLMPEPVCEVTFDRAELIGVLQGAKRAVAKKAPVMFAFNGQTATVSTVAEGVETYSATVGFRGSVDGLDTEIQGGKIAADPAYTLDAVQVLGDTVTLGIITPLRPMFWSSGEDSTRVIVMPIRCDA